MIENNLRLGFSGEEVSIYYNDPEDLSCCFCDVFDREDFELKLSLYNKIKNLSLRGKNNLGINLYRKKKVDYLTFSGSNGNLTVSDKNLSNYFFGFFNQKH